MEGIICRRMYDHRENVEYIRKLGRHMIWDWSDAVSEKQQKIFSVQKMREKKTETETESEAETGL